MDAKALVGSWSAATGDSHIDFRADGTYLRVSSFTLPMTYEVIALDDEGPFTVGEETVTFTPTSGHYRRNGLDEGFDARVRVQQARLEPDAAGDTLILDEAAWTRG